MRTEDLIATLAADTVRRPGAAVRLRRWLGPALILPVLAMPLVWGLRPDLLAALVSPAVLKTAAPLCVGLLALRAALRSARPDGDTGPAPGLIATLAIGLATLYALTLLQGPPSRAVTIFQGSTLDICLVSIPVLAALPLGAMLWALRDGASVSPARSATLAGLAAGGIAAALYSTFCTGDNPLYYVPAYSTGVLIATLIGRFAGARLLRW